MMAYQVQYSSEHGTDVDYAAKINITEDKLIECNTNTLLDVIKKHYGIKEPNKESQKKNYHENLGRDGEHGINIDD
jgi:hypothetical protein